MSFSRWSSVCLRTATVRYHDPMKLYQLNRKRYFHIRSNFGIIPKISESLSGRICSIQKYDAVKQFSTTSCLNFEKNDNSMIRLIMESKVVCKTQDVLVQFHDFTGLSWWATIIVAAFTARTVFVLPLAIHQHYVVAKLEEVEMELDTKVKAETTIKVNRLSEQYNWDSKKMESEYKRIMRQRRHEMILQSNCHPAKTAVIVLIQAPVWITLSSAIRNLIQMLPVQDTNAQIVYLQMKASHFLWFSDLTTPDQTLGIPIALAMVNLSLLQINHLAKKRHTGLSKFVLNVLRCFTLVVAYISSSVPSAVSLYWFTSSCYGLCQNLILSNSKVRQRLGIPITRNARRNPIQHSLKRIKNIIKFFRY